MDGENKYTLISAINIDCLTYKKSIYVCVHIHTQVHFCCVYLNKKKI